MWEDSKAFVLSKAYLDDWMYLEKVLKNDKKRNDGRISVAGRGAIKLLLRLSTNRKTEAVEWFVEEYPSIKEEMNLSLARWRNNDKGIKFKDYGNFINSIGENEFEKASKYAQGALSELDFYDYGEGQFVPGQKSLSKRSDSYFVSDYQHIICSSAFRRMQDKTQLFLLDPSDFSRRRLTHSIEVSVFCERIASMAKLSQLIHEDGRYNSFDEYDSCVLARCSGVLHDIGNPPFGHYGERVIGSFFENETVKKRLKKRGGTSFINDYYRELCVFDGNAQSLRIASKLLPFGYKNGVSLSAGVLGSIIKYPHGVKKGTNKLGYYKSEERVIKLLQTLGTFKPDYRNPFACILELADDLAYLVSDLEDGLHKELISFNDFKEVFKDAQDEYCQSFFQALKDHHDENEKYGYPFWRTVVSSISQFREDVLASLSEREDIFKQIVVDGVDEKFEIIKESKYAKLFDKLDKVKRILFMRCEDISINEIQGKKVIKCILSEFFDAIVDADAKWDRKTFENPGKSEIAEYRNKVLTLISKNMMKSVFDEMDLEKCKGDEKKITYYKMRLLIDYVSGMTDSYAVETYKTLNVLK